MIYINSMTIATNYKNKGGNYDTDKKRKISNFTGKSGENGRIGDEEDGYNFAVEVSDGKKQSFC